MKMKVKLFDLNLNTPFVVMPESDCQALGVKDNERVMMSFKHTVVSPVIHDDKYLQKGTILMPTLISKRIGVEDGDMVEVAYSQKPESVEYIRMKMDGKKLDAAQIGSIVYDILEGRLSKIEIAAWQTALYIQGMDIDEIAAFTKAMTDTGEVVNFSRSPVFDFHSLGGVPGNKITPIVVSIVAAAGLMIPKTSSRAISSACGTSDFVETFCNVSLEMERVRAIAEETGGVFSWGGSMNLAPVDDIVIKIENPLGINPRPQMLASIMSKKLAMGATHLLVDIPTGGGTKVATIEDAKSYARDLMDLGERIGMHVECAITYADQPVGNAIGPILEARECISILEGAQHPSSVIEKACECAGIIFEMAGIPNGADKAKELLDSGEAHRKFLEIVEAQDGNKDLKSTDLVPGKYTADIIASNQGYVHGVLNKRIVKVAKAAGSPIDKGAGIIIHKKKGQRVDEGETLMTIYADSEAKLQRAKETAIRENPFEIEGMLIRRVKEIKTI